MFPVRRAALLATAALCALAGCSRGSGTERTSQPVAFSDIAPERARYSPGDTTMITLRNVGVDELQYNLCAYRVERREETAWYTAAEVPPERSACVLPAGRLAPGEAVAMAVPLPDGLPPGEYRVRFDWIARAGGERLSPGERSSRSFRLVR
jgi:hypothetical protein